MKKYTRAVFVFILSLTFGLLLPRPAALAAEEPRSLGQTRVETLSDRVLNGFSETPEGWEPYANADEVTVAEKTDVYPYLSLTGDGCLIVRSYGVSSGEAVEVADTYREPLDVSGYESLFFPVNVRNAAEDAEYRVGIRIAGERGDYTLEKTVSPESWTGIFADISGFEGRSGVREIRIYAYFVKDGTENVPFEFCVDSICLSENGNAWRSSVFLADTFEAKGCEAIFEEDTLRLAGESENKTLGLRGLPFGLFERANAVKVLFSAENDVVPSLEDGNGNVVWKSGVSKGGSGVSTAYLRVPEADVSSLDLVFSCVGGCEVRIFGIEPYSFFFPSGREYGSIDNVSLSASGEEIIIKGTVSQRGAELLSGGRLSLYALDPNGRAEELKTGDGGEIASMTLMSSEFMFRIPTGDGNDSRSGLFKKYVAAVLKDGTLYILDDGKYVTNPEALSAENGRAVSPSNRRGYSAYGAARALELGGTENVIKVDVGRFFSASDYSSVRSETEYGVFYYNASYVESLDKRIDACYDRGINVTLLITLSRTGSDSIDGILIHPSSDRSGGECAFNTASQSASYLRFFSEFIAQRYCQTGKMKAGGIAFCEGADAAYDKYNMGRATLGEYVFEFARAYRVVYNSVRSLSPSVRFFVGIDCRWDSDLPFDHYTAFDGRAFLDCFNSVVAEYGNVEWGVMIDPYPEGKDDYVSLFDKGCTASPDTLRVGFSNLGVLCDYLSSDLFSYRGDPRTVAVNENTSFADRGVRMLSDYIYCFYKAASERVLFYVTDRVFDEEEVLKLIDTNLSIRNTYFAPEELGINDWKTAIRGFEVSKIVLREIGQGVTASSSPELTGKGTLFDFSAGKGAFAGYRGDEEFACESDIGGVEYCLTIRPSDSSGTGRSGAIVRLPSPKDFSLMPVIMARFDAVSMPPDVESALVRVTLYSGADICVSSAVIPRAVWSSLYFDFSAFTGLSSVDRIGITFESADGSSLGTPQFLVSNVEVGSFTLSDGEIAVLLGKAGGSRGFADLLTRENIMIATCAVGGLSLVLLIIRGARRRKKNSRASEFEEK